MDDGDKGTKPQGNWAPSNGDSPYEGDSVYARDSGSYTYEVALPKAGTYGVYVWYTDWSSREESVPYEVRHNGGTSVVRLDQRTNGG